jgi:uncharacterized protein (TIGR02118 family)
MAKMIVLYKTPKDVPAFERHYFETHIPLAKKLAGLRKYEVSQGHIMTPAGVSDIQFAATLHFDDMAAINRAFASQEGTACLEDRRVLAPNDDTVTMLLFDSQEV